MGTLKAAEIRLDAALEGVVQRIEALGQTVDDALNDLYDIYDYGNIQEDEKGVTTCNISLAEDIIHLKLLESFHRAIIESGSEEWTYPPLYNKIIENLMDSDHIRWNAECRVESIIDPTIVGSFRELEQVLNEIWESRGKEKPPLEERARRWRLYIYIPFSRGNKPNSRKKIKKAKVSYQDIMEWRFELLGKKIPYIWFLEYGTGPFAYPVTEPTHFIQNVETEVLGKTADEIVYGTADEIVYGTVFKHADLQDVQHTLDLVRQKRRIFEGWYEEVTYACDRALWTGESQETIISKATSTAKAKLIEIAEAAKHTARTIARKLFGFGKGGPSR